MKLKISGDKLTFSAAHILAHHNKCSRLHGHNYLIEVEAEGELDKKMMVIDFGQFKAKVRAILKRFDHKILIPANSKEFDIKKDEKEVSVRTSDNKFYRFPIFDVLLLPLEATTAELLAIYIHKLIKEEYPDLKLSISVSETPTSVAIYSE
ncbi:MAG: 6-pyruvoyl trahydropterin synthase family protein [Candidatus Heimdallarchaeaceae archaeon]